MFWLIFVPILVIILIGVISNFIRGGARKKHKDSDDGNIYKQTIFKEDD